MRLLGKMYSAKVATVTVRDRCDELRISLLVLYS